MTGFTTIFALACFTPFALSQGNSECDLGHTYCQSDNTTWRVYGCNTHEHLVPLSICPTGWTCAVSGDQASCVPPAIPPTCVPKFTIAAPAWGVLVSGGDELKFKIESSWFPGSAMSCAAPNPDGSINTRRVKKNNVYACEKTAEYRVTSLDSKAGLTMDLFITFGGCRNQLYGVMKRGFYVDWSCVPVSTLGFTCGKSDATYVLEMDYVAPLDVHGCLPVVQGSLMGSICPGTWS